MLVNPEMLELSLIVVGCLSRSGACLPGSEPVVSCHLSIHFSSCSFLAALQICAENRWHVAFIAEDSPSQNVLSSKASAHFCLAMCCESLLEWMHTRPEPATTLTTVAIATVATS
jgi:hypothetical protein